MSRSRLLGAASAAALASFAAASHAVAAQPQIQGGGSTLAQYQYINEFSTYNASVTGANAAVFATYWESGSGAGQSAFLNDDLSCDTNKVTGNDGGSCSGIAPTGTNPTTNGPNYVDYGASDSTLSSTQISTWATYSYGQAAAGNLIQLPSMGVGVSFPVINTSEKTNGATSLSDNDLCEIFSGGYTDFSQITDSVSLKKVANKYAAGTINVIYRGDGSGTSFLLTSHLASVCTAADTAPGFTFTATTTFASLFNAGNGGGSFTKNSAGLYVVVTGLGPNSQNDGPKGSGGIATQLEDAPTVGQISYLSPDFTTVDPKSNATVNGAPSTLRVASVLLGTTPELPNVTNVGNALAHPKAGTGTNTNPPSTAAEGANPNNWVPTVPLVTEGYPVVGYTTYDFPQCYASKAISGAVVKYLKTHYTKSGPDYTSLTDNGFVAIANTKSAAYITTIVQNILANTNSWNTNIGNPTACSGLVGR